MTSTSKQVKMIEAAEAGNLHYVQEKLQKDHVEINARDPYGMTALMRACQAGQDPVVTYLLEEGADLEAKVPFSKATALVLACQFGKVSTAEILLESGANTAAGVNESPLHEAAQYGKEDLVELLLEYGAQVNALDFGRYTPLHYACCFGQSACVEVLLRYGADIRVRTKEGQQTPLDLAEEYGYKAIIELLIQHAKEAQLSNDQTCISSKRTDSAALEYNSTTSATLLEEKLTSKIQDMERKFEKQLEELRQRYESKEEEMCESLKQVQGDLARSNEKVIYLERQVTEVSSLKERLRDLEEKTRNINGDLDSNDEQPEDNLDSPETKNSELLAALQLEWAKSISSWNDKFSSKVHTIESSIESMKTKNEDIGELVLKMTKRIGKNHEMIQNLECEIGDGFEQFSEEILEFQGQVTRDISSLTSTFNEKLDSYVKSIRQESNEIGKERNESISKLSVRTIELNEKLRHLEKAFLERKKEEGQEMTKTLQTLYDHLAVFAENSLKEKM